MCVLSYVGAPLYRTTSELKLQVNRLEDEDKDMRLDSVFSLNVLDTEY